MKTNLILLALLCWASIASGQIVRAADIMIVDDSLYLNGTTVGSIVTSISGAGTNSDLPTSKAVVDYVAANGGGGGGTSTGDTVTILAYGNSYIINNSDTSSTGIHALAYSLNQNIYAYDFRRDSIGVLVEDESLWGSAPLNAPPQIIGGGDGLGIDRFPRNTTWQNHFAKQLAAEDPARKVFMLTAGKGGIGSDSLLYSFYWDSLQSYVTEAIAANAVYGHYDYVFLSLGPLEDAPSLESSLLNYRDSLFSMGVIDDRTQFIVKEQPSDAITNLDWYQVLPYLDKRYDWVSAVYGVKDSTTADGTHPTPYQLKSIGERAYKVLTGKSQTDLTVDDAGNVNLGKSSLYGLTNTYRNFFSNPYTFDPTAVDSLVNVFYWNPDSVLFSGYYRNFYNIGSNFTTMAGFTDAQNILIYGWDNLTGAGTLRDSIMIFGYGNGTASTRQFNVIGGKYNNPGHANVDYVMSANQTSSATGDKFLFKGVSAANVYIGELPAWDSDQTLGAGQDEYVLTFDNDVSGMLFKAPNTGTDDQTLSISNDTLTIEDGNFVVLPAGSSGGIDSLLADTSPELGGNLNLNSNWISGDGGNEGITVAANGFVGINTDTPYDSESPLTISNEGNNTILAIQTAATGAGENPSILFQRSRGTIATPTGVANNDFLAQMAINAHNGTAYEGTRRVMQIDASETWSVSAGGFRWGFYSRSNGTVGAPTERLRIDHDGSLDLKAYGSGSFTGTASRWLAVDASGNLIEEAVPTDNQTVDTLSLNGTTLTLALENDGDAPYTVDLSSLQDGTGTDDQTLSISNDTLTIENGNFVVLPASGGGGSSVISHFMGVCTTATAIDTALNWEYIPLDVQVNLGDDFSHTLGNNFVTIDSTGLYEVSATVAFDVGSPRTDIYCRVIRNGTLIPGCLQSSGATPFSANAFDKEGLSIGGAIFSATAGDKIQLQAAVAVANWALDGANTTLRITRLE